MTSSNEETKEGEQPLLPLGRPTADQSTRRETSDDAYGRSLSGQRDALLRAIKRTPRTCDEIMSLGWAHQSASAGINWLMRQGYIVDSGERRKTRMGRSAIVWRWEQNPVPVNRLRPTRKELQRRIDAAIEEITENLSSESRIIRIIKGDL